MRKLQRLYAVPSAIERDKLYRDYVKTKGASGKYKTPFQEHRERQARIHTCLGD